MLAALDRAEGVHRCAVGDGAHAVALLRRSQEQFAALGMPMERGRSLIALTAAERRRRHRSAARAAQQLAEQVFAEAGAPGWAAAARITAEPAGSPAHGSPARRPASSAPVSTTGPTGSGPLALTDAEARIVAMVTEGAHWSTSPR
ncbi:hypothetical protein AB0B66_40175 [Catellatospora sp. NPDC049111]|uniref:hypothetical protein n=1 Tax=Catellatospora sp. NPDC049111 TaxID=3155271 RepID=UPI0033C592A1